MLAAILLRLRTPPCGESPLAPCRSDGVRFDTISSDLMPLHVTAQSIVPHDPLRRSAECGYARRMQTTDLITAEELERMGRSGFQYELVRGRLVQMNPPNHEHGRVAVEVAAALLQFVRTDRLGSVVVESGYTLARNPDVVRGPDVSFVRKGRSDYPPVRGFYIGAPDLAVEVRSPDDSVAELLAKAAEYLAAGTELVWIIDPIETTVHVLSSGAGAVTLGPGDALSGGTTVPGFTLSIGALFAPGV